MCGCFLFVRLLEVVERLRGAGVQGLGTSELQGLSSIGSRIWQSSRSLEGFRIEFLVQDTVHTLRIRALLRVRPLVVSVAFRLR